jgi:hypothetical protein
VVTVAIRSAFLPVPTRLWLRQQTSAALSLALVRFRRLKWVDYHPIILDLHQSTIFGLLSFFQQLDSEPPPLVGVE